MNDQPSDPFDESGEGSGKEPDKRGDGDQGGDAGSAGQNPFAGTPFEALFGGMSGGQGFPGFPGMPTGPGGMPDLSALMGQIQSMMQPHDGTLNWPFVIEQARKTVAQSPDPSPTQKQKDAVDDVVRLADLWLDETTEFGSGVTLTAAWSRAEWVEGTSEVWKVLVEPIADQAVNAMGTAMPEEAQAMAGPLLGMMQKAAGMMVAGQVAAGIGALASEVLSTSDIGLPLGPAGKAALLPENVQGFADGLDVTTDDVLLYLALREAAHQRLFAGVPWLRDHLLGAVTDYARGIEVDTGSIEEQLRGFDISNPESLQSALEGGLFDLKKSPAQEAALSRLEVTLALVEGWVDEIVSQATAERMPSAGKLQEAFRRRRASGGPAEQTFASLVGLELRPRRLREASTLWGSLRTRQGAEARDGVWMHPALLPTAADLDDPLGFREDATAPQQMSEEDFDTELARLLDGEQKGDDTPGAGDDAGNTDNGNDSPGDDSAAR